MFWAVPPPSCKESPRLLSQPGAHHCSGSVEEGTEAHTEATGAAPPPPSLLDCHVQG